MNKNNKTVSTLLVTALLVNSSSIIAVANETNLSSANQIDSINVDYQNTVSIPDSTLLSEINTALNRGDLTAAVTSDDLKNITTLNLTQKGITDLTGLELAVNLEELNVSGNHIKSLKPISNLSNLKKLDISSTGLTSLEYIKNLVSLTKLSMNGNSISDISILSKFTNLAELEFARCKVSDISPLKSLSSLSTVSMNDQSITLPAKDLLGVNFYTKNTVKGLKGEFLKPTSMNPTCGNADTDNLSWIGLEKKS